MMLPRSSSNVSITVFKVAAIKLSNADIFRKFIISHFQASKDISLFFFNFFLILLIQEEVDNVWLINSG